ncbi:unnamed protein product [Mytilus edulis]|uniref:Uncharacterized protein n=1 Tax=Mytilus edulis TaxID=6550 RepID=A0A8S3VLM0_MYTED|nr:unnamed protein product [Mytilus edulis]
MKRFRKRSKKNYNVQQGDEKEKQNANATNTNQEDDYDGRVYDLIDESQMIDISPQYSNLPVNSSVAKDELNLSDGYLNSYQPMIPDPVIHDYTKVNPVDETDQPKYINVLDEHHSIFRMPQSNETINSSVQNSLASPFRDNVIHPQRSDYISMHQNDLLSTGINLPMECHTGTVISNEIDES